jgi:hypothetical protein
MKTRLDTYFRVKFTNIDLSVGMIAAQQRIISEDVCDIVTHFFYV